MSEFNGYQRLPNGEKIVPVWTEPLKRRGRKFWTKIELICLIIGHKTNGRKYHNKI